MTTTDRNAVVMYFSILTSGVLLSLFVHVKIKYEHIIILISDLNTPM